MKYYPVTKRTVFEYPPCLESSASSRDFVFHSRPLPDGQFQRACSADTPFTATEPFDMHVSRARP